MLLEECFKISTCFIVLISIIILHTCMNKQYATYIYLNKAIRYGKMALIIIYLRLLKVCKNKTLFHQFKILEKNNVKSVSLG